MCGAAYWLIRRECLDHVLVLGEAQAASQLKTYAVYYTDLRTHLSLDKDAPNFRRPQRVGGILAIAIIDGPHHQYVRV